MKLIYRKVYNLPDLDYFKYELGWDFVNDMEEVIEFLQSLVDDELVDILGLPDEYYEVK